MQINERTRKLLADADFTAEHVVECLDMICRTNAVIGGGDTQLTLDYQDSETVVKPGDMIPFITIGLRQGVVIRRDDTELEKEVKDLLVEDEK